MTSIPVTSVTSVAVKICGISEPATLDAAVEAGARWIGFNLFPRSPRVVTVADATVLAARLPPHVTAVALLVEPDDEAVASLLAAIPGAVLQVYAGETRVHALKRRFGRETWRAVPLAPGETPPGATAADRLLVEAAPRAGDAAPGGNGHALDWTALRTYRSPVPWMLAGGLTPDNVALAIRESGAEAVDVSSGVEHARGIKDATLIRRFIRAATLT